MSAVSGWLAVLSVSTVVLFALNLAFNNDGSRSAILGEDVQPVGEVSDEFDSTITPRGIAFAIWGLIYFWNAVLMVFALYDAFAPLFRGFRRGRVTSDYHAEEEAASGLDKHLLTPLFYLSYSLTCVSSAVWIYVWTNEKLGLSVLFLLLMNVGLWGAIAAVFSHYRSLTGGRKEGFTKFQRNFSRFDFFGFHAFVVNGLFIYATWVAVALLLNLTTWVAFDLKTLSAERMATVSLVILICEVALWFTAQNTFLERYTRYLVIDYLVLFWAVGWSLDKNYKAGATNTIVTIALLALIGLCFVVRICLLIGRAIHRRAESTRTQEREEPAKATATGGSACVV
ncbi:unnamed protein product [Vitrella brassicaformis CCMP3155]|uniref:Uncharacterized protein n=2 Tax=Vitrella brassicaformis TaxID=1169539 RepID=A0A0G4GIC0_VITBC|nr:unnamed protein product [Vitrella brassicaformis CCMP3155]|mmetsp:Transcript_23560/g.58226  ORF Transcript_23560/g.58226 Transcript_23560/m.58226 type:complete len:341 (+) Transcript_23560:67-1089(+)|eukprot:CEM29577.1 unnamed protein product [Vitrella brassicaformis CCMP3155]